MSKNKTNIIIQTDRNLIGVEVESHSISIHQGQINDDLCLNQNVTHNKDTQNPRYFGPIKDVNQGKNAFEFDLESDSARQTATRASNTDESSVSHNVSKEQVQDLNLKRPSKSIPAHMWFINEILKEINQNKKVNAKNIAEQWMKLSKEDKRPYVKKAEQDAIRYATEMVLYKKVTGDTEEDDENSKKIEAKDKTLVGKNKAGRPKGAKNKKTIVIRKQAKGFLKGLKNIETQVRPKKQSGPFQFLIKERSHEIMKQHRFKNIGPTLKVLSETWKTMTDTEKKPYFDLSQKDGVRHEKQCQELDKNGYFILESGEKSTTLEPKVKLLGKRRKPNTNPLEEQKSSSSSESEKNSKDSSSDDSGSSNSSSSSSLDSIDVNYIKSLRKPQNFSNKRQRLK